MNPTRTFRELILWQRAHQFILKTYSVTAKFPREEIYGLTSQFRRAAVSISSNIAEGYAKRGRADTRRYLNIAQGSLEECRYYIILATDSKFYEDPQLNNLLEEVSKLLNAYAKAFDNEKVEKN